MLIPREFARPEVRGRNLHATFAALVAALAPVKTFAEVLDGGPAAPLHARHGAVASDSADASAAGAEMLRAGGNAVDAACATALALGVVHPFASGIGGGGFALVHLPKSNRTVALDFRETAPAGISIGQPGAIAIAPQSGHSVGVPGELRGLGELVKRYGRLPFSRCVEPALRLAKGFAVTPWIARQISDELARNPQGAPGFLADVFALGNRPAAELRVGDRVSRPALGKTLARIRRDGAEAFYRGAIAREIVKSVTTAGGTITLDDLASYAPVERSPLVVTFHGRRIVTMPPPSAGGLVIAEALGILANHLSELRRTPDGPTADTVHWLAEALKHGFADRARFLGDPGFAQIPLAHLLDPAYHRELASRTRPDHVLVHDQYGTVTQPPLAPARDAGTSHISVVDEEGNAVALTSTVNLDFGARILAGKTGIVLNDQLDDFSSPSGADVFAIPGGDANRPAPGKRPVSSMSPVIVLGEHGVELVTGAAGGPRIISATLQVLLNVMVFGLDARKAVAEPRVHAQWEPDLLFHEAAISPEILRDLRSRGHHPKLRPDIGKANAIVRSGNGLEAASDPRTGGSPAGY